jgi:magnesium transporter
LEKHHQKTLERIESFVEERDNDKIISALSDLHAADIAELIGAVKREERAYIFNLLPREIKADVIIEFDDTTRELLVSALDNTTIADLVEELDTDEAADIVQNLPENQQEEILETVGHEIAEDVQELMAYEEDTAGGIMRLEYIEVTEDTLIKDINAIARKQSEDEEIESFYNIWVSDERGVLRGYARLHDILVADPKKKIKNIMRTDLRFVHPDVDQEEVARLSVKYNLVTVPVIDNAGKLMGVITFDDIADVIDEEADEDITRLSGSGDIEISEESAFKISKARIPWLLVALAGELISAFVIFQFEADLKKAVVLSFFFPVIMAMAGNVGIQSSAIVVRGLATGEISGLNLKRRLVREIKAALINGIICAVILFSIILLVLKSIKLGITVATALISVIFIAATIGTLMPFILHRFKVDPAISTGPFITTSNDVLGLLIYLLIVTSIL